MNLRGTCSIHGGEVQVPQLPLCANEATPAKSLLSRRRHGRHPAAATYRARRPQTAAAQTVQAEAEVVSIPQTATQCDTPAPGSLVPLQLQQGTVVADGSRPVLQGLTELAEVTASSRGQLVLGLTSPGQTAMFDVALGQLSCRRFLACARCKLWWMTPEWGSTASQIPPETQFVLLELEESRLYAVLLPLIDSGTWRGTLRPPPRNSTTPEHIHLRVESGDRTMVGDSWRSMLLCAAGTEPFELVEHAVAVAGSMSGGAKPRIAKQLPASLDTFGWCTWDAYYSTVSAQGLQEGLRSLHRGGIRPGMLIIDDGWQCTDVDPPLRDPTKRPPGLPSNTAIDEFYDAELEMLRMGARDIPGGSSLGVTLEALSADEESMQHHYRSQPHRGREELPWRKKRSERRKTRQQERQASGDSLNAPAEPLPSAVLSSRAERYDSWTPESQLSRETVELSQDKLPDADGQKDTLDFRESNVASGPSEQALAGILADNDLSVSERLRRADMLSAESISPTIVAEPENTPGFVMWILQAATQRLVGLVVGLGQALIVKFYQYVVDPAPADSWAVRFFTWLALGPARSGMLEFFATSGDFTRRLTSIKANSKFSSPSATADDYFSGKPEALAGVVHSLKTNFGLRFVYVWHGLSAYWSGVSTHDEPVAKYNPRIVYAEPTAGLAEIEPSMRWNPAVISGIGVPESAEQLYADMHSYLASSGITGVKVDCQAGVGLSGSVLGGGSHVARQYHDALEDSVMRNFPGNHCINCMCHTTENLYRLRDTAVARASDDFYPRDLPSSFPHIAACAFNSVFLSGLVQPDWDMFHSVHPAATLHATARAVSGGAVYVSDYPGKHNFDILHRLVLEDGSILRALLPGRPTRDCLFSDVLRDGKSLLKVWNANRCSGLVAVFHLQGSSWDRARRQFCMHDSQPAPCSTHVSPADIESFTSQALQPCKPVSAGKNGRALLSDVSSSSSSSSGSSSSAREFIAWSEAFGNNRMKRLGLRDRVPIELAAGGSTVVTVAPIMSHSGVDFAPIGLIDMLNPGGAMLAVSCDTSPKRWHTGSSTSTSNRQRRIVSELCLQMEVRGAGKFAVFCSRRPLHCRVTEREVEHQYDADSGLLTFCLERGGPTEHVVTLVL